MRFWRTEKYGFLAKAQFVDLSNRKSRWGKFRTGGVNGINIFTPGVKVIKI